MICVDSSVAAQWFFTEEHSAQADSLLQAALASQEPIVAPPLLPSEMMNLLRQRQRAGALTLPQAQALLMQFLAVPISLRFPRRMYRRILELADQFALLAVAAHTSRDAMAATAESAAIVLPRLTSGSGQGTEQVGGDRACDLVRVVAELGRQVAAQIQRGQTVD
jgi:predicted nucleic acid-binding protein